MTGARIARLGGLALGLAGLAPARAAELAMLTPVDLTAVRLADDFWRPRQEINRTRTLPHVLGWCERTHRIANFESAAGRGDGRHEGYFFNDSDVYKAIEGAALILAQHPDRAIEQRLDDLIAVLAAAQQPDGYLNTYFQVAKPGQRWTDDRFHELYCAGHLVEAALAHQQATGKTALLDVARRFIDHIDTVFGPGKRLEAPEHPEIELALLKLWQATGEPRYLALARFFLDQRGQDRGRPGWGEYAQDHRPLRAQTEVVGHAVRAMYLYCAATDLAGRAGDETYLPALESLWQDLVGRKMYVTGGIGVSAKTEGFSRGYDLPNEHSYAETCASIGLALWSHRMNLLYRDARYADVFERVVYNGVLSGVALDGDKFLYANPLASRGVDQARRGSAGQGESAGHRQPWFKCACCPPNVLRFIAGIGGCVYAHAPDAIYVNLYAAGGAEVTLDAGRVRLTQQTDYPWDGHVELTIEPETDQPLVLYLRIPGWCDSARVTVNGVVEHADLVRGYARLEGAWHAGDRVALDLPMEIVRVECDPRVQANAGRLAIQRGPLVYCLEQADNPAGALNLAIARDARLSAQHRPDLLGGVTVITGPALRRPEWPADGRLYHPAWPPEPVSFTAVPYCVWDNRSPGEMVVWVAESPAQPQPESQPAAR